MNPQRLLIFYDAKCNLCQAAHTALSGSDGLFDFVNIHEPCLVARHPQLKGLPINCEMHAIDPDGNLTAGYDALTEIAKRLPSFRPFIPLLEHRAVRSVGWKLYRFIARNRYTIFGGEPSTEACTIA